MKDFLHLLLGPRPTPEQHRQAPLRYLAPPLCFGAAAVLLLISIQQPYWRMDLHAPQYPQGLHVQVYVNRSTGDVREIDELNHYIGMRKLEDAAVLERTLSIIAISAFALLVLAAIVVHSPLSALLTLPALTFPAVFLADMAFWLQNYGRNLDPSAPLRNAIKPFVPPLLGVGTIGQFKTVATAQLGLHLAFAASILILVGLILQRRAYKPLMEQWLASQEEPSSAAAETPAVEEDAAS